MSEEIQRVLGRMEGQLDSILKNQIEFKKTTIEGHDRHETQIQKLTKRQNLQTGAGSAIFGIILAWKPIAYAFEKFSG